MYLHHNDFGCISRCVACQAFVFTLEEVFLLHDLLMAASLLLEAQALLAPMEG